MEKGSSSMESKHPPEMCEVAEILIHMSKAKLDQKSTPEVCEAAEILIHMSKAKLDQKSTVILHTMLDSERRRVSEEFDRLAAATNYRPPPHILQIPGLDGLIGRCSEPFEKQLTESDVKVGQSRLVMGKFDVKKYLMPLLSLGENLDDGIPVTTYDIHGNPYRMEFKKWAEKIYVLKSGWKKFCLDHGLIKLKDSVTVWMFRHVGTGKLCFAITTRRLPEEVSTTEDE